ncbi:MAG: hypothetical protein AAGC60_07015 [Acidobacteriota bacterium]
MMHRHLARLFALLLLFVAGSAGAHPFDAESYSARADVRLDEKRGLRVRVYVEVPAQKVLAEFMTLYDDPMTLGDEEDQAFRERMWTRLGTSLGLTVDGARPAGGWVPADDPRNGYGTAEFFLYALEFVPDDPRALLDERVAVHVDLDVFPGEEIYLSAAARAKAPWQVASTTIDAILAADGLVDPATGRWTLDRRLRDVDVVFVRPGG